MKDILILSADTFLQDRAFALPNGVRFKICDITAENALAVQEKALHNCGELRCEFEVNGKILEGKVSDISKVATNENFSVTLQAADFLTKSRHNFNDLIYIVHRLRDKDGCEWDKAQTHESIRANCIEEAFELVDAINNCDIPNMREETGDVLLQSALHAVIAEDNKEYDISDVLSELCHKLIIRHPHVFGDVHVANSVEALASWEQAKMKEKKQRNVTERMMHVAGSLPSTMRASKIQKYAAGVGFDWKEAKDCVYKVDEELQEFLTAEEAEKEMEGGDLLFAVVNLLRKSGINPEVALDRSVNKFVRRFSAVENVVTKSGREMKELSLEELDAIYNQVKSQE